MHSAPHPPSIDRVLNWTAVSPLIAEYGREPVLAGVRSVLDRTRQAARSGDRVEILTGKVIEPSRDWLSSQHGFLTTHRAREKVRSWFKRVDLAQNLAAGRALLERELKRLALQGASLEGLPERFQLHGMDALFEALALGDVTSGQVARHSIRVLPVQRN